MNNLVQLQADNTVLFPSEADKNTVSRLRRFIDWMDYHSRPWWEPDLAAYRDFLLRVGGNDGIGLAPSSVQAHLATIRGRYQYILRDRRFQIQLMKIAGLKLIETGYEDTPANRKAVADELRTVIQNAVHPSTAPVTVVVDQDPTHIRLTVAQANELIQAPDSLRDKAVISLLLATGIREGELCALHAEDLHDHMDDGSLALRVRHGKGAKSRKVPYGEHDTVLRVVAAWIHEAQITTGRVFPITTRTVQRILERYPLFVDGKEIRARPHDLRRTYARRLYEAGVDLTAIQQNLGHADPKTTLGYIGELSADARKPPEVFKFE